MQPEKVRGQVVSLPISDRSQSEYNHLSHLLVQVDNSLLQRWKERGQDSGDTVRLNEGV